MAADDFNSAIKRSHAAVSAIFGGDPEPAKTLFSDEDDITLGNPFGPFAHGRRKVVEAFTAAARNYRDGEVTDVDLVAKYVSDGLACIVEVEHGRAKIGGSDQIATLALRVTSLFRLEHGMWKLVHRHADPITTPRPAASVIAQPD
jgi:ketosteroid isomerase-like protein